jgi:hypothetical protein
VYTPFQRAAWVLFGLMTAITFLGPLIMYLVLRGGEHDGWPPEGPLEWGTAIGVIAVGSIVFLASLIVAFKLPKVPKR